MAENSKIEWTDHTFNPWIGCTKVGPGCDNCYAEAMMDHRYHRVQWGAGNPRQRTSAANWRKPLAWNRAAEGGPRPRVFCASLADVFDNEAPDAWRSDLWRLIQATPNLDWLLLTKRIGNAHRMLPAFMKPFPNLWIGATVVNQEEADRDIPKLLDVPATVRFLSCEPLLGPISFEGRWVEYDDPSVHENWLERIDWIIAGGESGPAARLSHPDWFRSLRDQCVAAGVPFLFKQWGEWVSPGHPEFGRQPNAEFAVIDSAGKILSPPPMDEDADALTVVRVGKKRAGRLLDGRTWDEFPS